VASAGDVAGTISKRDGRRSVRIEGKKYLIRRVIWFIVTGADPDNFQLDHRDLDRLNNCFSNPRLATGSGDNANKRRFRTKASLPKRCQGILRKVLTEPRSSTTGPNLPLRHDTAEEAGQASKKSQQSFVAPER